jgi:predicted transcriptional regulator of viral defense system
VKGDEKMKYEQLNDLLENGNGYIRRGDSLKLGISGQYFSDYVNDKSLVRVARGMYKTKDTWYDEHYIISEMNEKICFSHETALYLNELMERVPKKIMVSAPRGYNSTHLRNKNIKVFHLEQDKFLLGQTILKTSYGNDVKTYNKERAICDLIRYKENTDIEIFQTAMKLYFNRSDKNIHQLMKYAKVFGIEDLMRNYLEVLL